MVPEENQPGLDVQPISEEPQIDNGIVEQPHEHRSKDADGNPDDKLNEDEALAQAKEEGIEFTDFYLLTNTETFSPVDGQEFKTKAEAQKALNKRDDKDKLTITQGRRRK